MSSVLSGAAGSPHDRKPRSRLGFGGAGDRVASAEHNAPFGIEVQRLRGCCPYIAQNGFARADERDDVLGHLAEEAQPWALVDLGRQHGRITYVNAEVRDRHQDLRDGFIYVLRMDHDG